MLKDLPPEVQAKLKPEIAAAQAGCQHHWQIDTPHGATSKARCLHCGAQKEFANDLTPQQYRDVATHRSAFHKAERGSEMTEPKGAGMTRRAIEIAPAREKAVKLFAEGKTVREVREALGPECGTIADCTLYNWRDVAKKNGHGAAVIGNQTSPGAHSGFAVDVPPAVVIEKASEACKRLHAGDPPDAGHPALKVLLDMLPVADGKHGLWLKAFQATYELIFLEVAK